MEQCLLRNKYTDITVFAIFFTSVPVSTLQQTFAPNPDLPPDVINVFWIASMIASIASAANGLLALSWHTSFMYVQFKSLIRCTFTKPNLLQRSSFAIRSDNILDEHKRKLEDRCLESCPMAFLVLSGVLFVAGFVILLFEPPMVCVSVECTVKSE